MASRARIFVAASMLAATTFAATPWLELSHVGNMRISSWTSTSKLEPFDTRPYALFEAHDPGRFLSNSPIFARAIVPRYWALSPHNATVDDEGGRWSTVDVDQCYLDFSKEITTYQCDRERIVEATECTPANPNSCAVDVQQVSDNFVEFIRLRHGKGHIVATNLKEFTIHRSYIDVSVNRQVNKTFTQRTPSTGVFRVPPFAGASMVIGDTVLDAFVAWWIEALHPKPLRFESPISTEALKEPHRAFVLHVDKDGAAVIRYAP